VGFDIPAEEIERVLKALGFSVAKSDPWLVGVPTWRPDIEGKADLVEEAARIVGFDKLPSLTLPALRAVETPKLTPAQDRRRLVRRALACRGMLEAVTWSFADERIAALFCDGRGLLAGRGLILDNPIASELGAMRPSALPNLIAALKRNRDRGRRDLALFEVAPVYCGDRPEDQETVAAGARLSEPPRHWRGQAPRADEFAAKADALAALAAAGADTAQTQTTADAPSWFHPGRSGVLRLGPKTTLAHFGEIHPRALAAMDVEGPIVAFEAFLDRVPAARPRATKTKPALDASDLLPLSRDFAFVVEDSVAAGTLLRAVAGADRKLIEKVSLFDVYRGKGVADGKKSLAVEVLIQPREKTLTDQEIEALSRKIVDAVAKATGGSLRA
jgi:phenylalanyl-tRNA synthetase beta chain